MKRHPDWPKRLYRAIEARAAAPHQWGVNDCCLYAADLVEAMTGEDLAAPFRGTYRSEADADAVMRAMGWASLADMMDAMLPRWPHRPRRGDVVLLPGQRGDYLAVVHSGGLAIAPDIQRPTLRDLGGLIAAWRVG